MPARYKIKALRAQRQLIPARSQPCPVSQFSFSCSDPAPGEPLPTPLVTSHGQSGAGRTARLRQEPKGAHVPGGTSAGGTGSTVPGPRSRDGVWQGLPQPTAQLCFIPRQTRLRRWKRGTGRSSCFAPQPGAFPLYQGAARGGAGRGAALQREPGPANAPTPDTGPQNRPPAQHLRSLLRHAARPARCTSKTATGAAGAAGHGAPGTPRHVPSLRAPPDVSPARRWQNRRVPARQSSPRDTAQQLLLCRTRPG